MAQFCVVRPKEAYKRAQARILRSWEELNSGIISAKDLLKCAMASHTILLVQSSARPESRTYADYDSVNECLEGICKIFEEHLKKSNPSCPSITYDISQLFDFVDQLADLSSLVFQKTTGTYVPHNKDWLKEKIYVMLRKQAGK